MDWASQRRMYYAGGIVVVLIISIGIPIYNIISTPPSCTDRKQNGDERGIDCGGACSRMCAEDVRSPIVHFARVFPVSDGFYDAVAYVENQNTGAEAREAIYRFKTYDADNILIAEKIGKTYMRAGEAFAVFLGGIRVGEREPRHVFFEFEPDIRFDRAERKEAPIVASAPLLENPDGKPRLTAKLKNRTALSVRNVEAVAILYAGENAIAASATHIDEIKGNSEELAVFTWPSPISGVVTRIEIISRPENNITR